MSKSRTLVCLLWSVFVLTSLSYGAAPDRILSPIDSSAVVPLTSGAYPKAQTQYDLGSVEPSFTLGYMTLMTAPSAAQQKALDQLLVRQQNPSSRDYHKWLTPAQYADQFGLSPNDIGKITQWLKSQGFAIQSIGGGRNTVIFAGTAAQVQSAFGTEIHRYNLNGVEHYAPATPVMVPSALSGIVVGIRGLHDFRAHPMNVRRVDPSYTLVVAGSGNEYFMAPGDIATVYDINPLYNSSPAIDGTGQKLAIMGETDIYLTDINNFRSGFGLSQISGCTSNTNGVVTACSATNFKYVLILPTGQTDPGSPNSLQDDLAEADLDIEWSGATARNAQIVYVNAPSKAGNGVFDSLQAAINPPSGPPLAPVVSMSYGNCEASDEFNVPSEIPGMETELQQGASEGVTVMNSSGDTGAAGCDGGPPNNTPPYSAAEFGLSVNYPASSQWVTAVGGTAYPMADFTSTYWTATGTTSTVNYGASALPALVGQEVAWNDDVALAQFCVSNPTVAFCNPSPGVKVTSAQTFQEDYWISIGGGGASNCATANTTADVCTAGFPQPTWQQTLSVSGAPAGVRYVPDVSLIASPNLPGYIFCTQLSELGNSGTGSSCGTGGAAGITNALNLPNISVIGGTSVSTPVFAGIVTLLNQYLGSTGLGSINQKLYSLAATPANGAFHQVTSGNNDVYCQPGTPAGQPSAILCPSAGVFGFNASSKDATTGYNLVTGLGSVDANQLAIAWAASLTSFNISASAPSPASISAGNTATTTVTISPVNGFSQNVNLTCSGPSGVSCSAGSVTGGSGTAQITIQTLPNTPTGAATVTIKGTSASGDVTETTTVSLTVTTSQVTFSLGATIAGGTLSVSQGQTTGAVNMTVTSTSNPSFVVSNGSGGTVTSLPVTYTCTGLPSEATCAFTAAGANSSQQITSSATSVTLTIQTTAPTTKLERPLDREPKIFYAVLLPGLLGIFVIGGSRKRLAGGVRVLGLILVLGASTMWLASCGGSSTSNNKNPGTPVGSTSITVNATTSGGPSSTLQFTLTVTAVAK